MMEFDNLYATYCDETNIPQGMRDEIKETVMKTYAWHFYVLWNSIYDFFLSFFCKDSE